MNFDQRISITPFYKSLAERLGRLDLTNPLWRQVAAATQEELTQARPDRLITHDNWENPAEFPTRTMHHKYDDRVIIRAANRCLGYCTFCLQALRVLDAESSKPEFEMSELNRIVAYLETHPEVREVILSGGDPLLLSDAALDRMLTSIRAVSSVETIRVHSRALTFAPARITQRLCELFLKHDVTIFAVHIAHPGEMSEEFVAAARMLTRHVPRLVAQMPLMKGVNDDVGTLSELFRGLHRLGIDPYYLLHTMPHTLAPSRFRTPVRLGTELLQAFDRGFTHPAVPEYIIVHETGKRTVPKGEDPTFRYEARGDGWPVINFLNWKGDWETYLDSPK
jgi:lysine 2,3-aminomutase